MSSSHGQKVTTDPATTQNPKNENPGVVTSDSLAGENIKEGGSFAANADARGPMAQKSAGTTTNTTDTSGATTLEAARDSSARGADTSSSSAGGASSGSGSGQRSDNVQSITPGTGPSDTSSGSSTSAPDSSIGSAGSVAAGGVGDTTNQPSAGGAGIPAQVAGGPKGANLTEDPNLGAAEGSAEIGSENDPGRLALGRTDVPVSGGAGARQGEVTGDGQFDALKDTSA